MSRILTIAVASICIEAIRKLIPNSISFSPFEILIIMCLLGVISTIEESKK